MFKIIISWVLSPAISGILSAIFFVSIRNCVLRKKNPEEKLITIFPLIIATAMAIYTIFIVYKGTPVLKLNKIPTWVGICIALGVGLVSALLTKLCYVPYLEN